MSRQEAFTSVPLSVCWIGSAQAVFMTSAVRYVFSADGKAPIPFLIVFLIIPQAALTP
jgi:hypothetical protein